MAGGEKAACCGLQTGFHVRWDLVTERRWRHCRRETLQYPDRDIRLLGNGIMCRRRIATEAACFLLCAMLGPLRALAVDPTEALSELHRT